MYSADYVQFLLDENKSLRDQLEIMKKEVKDKDIMLRAAKGEPLEVIAAELLKEGVN